MRRFSFFIILFILLIISIFNGCQSSYDNIRVFYVSNHGSDRARGDSPHTAWKTIKKVNSVKFMPGDSILFEAGGTWRDILVISNSGTKENFIVYSRYGKGRNPRIIGSEKAKDWVQTSIPNVWKTKSILSDFSTYPKTEYPARIFFLKTDSVTWGNFCEYSPDYTKLVKDFDYTVSGTTHYIYSTTDPNAAYDSVEVTQRKHCIQMPINFPKNYIEINGIDVKFSRLNGFYTGYPEYDGATGLIFRNCNVGYIGMKGSGCAYGLGVWHSNLLVENCTFSDCGRRAISLNLYKESWPLGKERKIENVIIRNNIFKRGYHTTSLDLACSDGDGDTIQNVYFYNNLIDDHQLIMTDEDKTSNQVFVQSLGGKDEVNNIYIVNNLFIQATARNIGLDNCDTVYILNNTFVGHNTNLTVSPYGNVATGGSRQIDYRNNLLYDNLGDNSLANFGLHEYNISSGYLARDYNLYYSLNPKNDRCFTSIFSNGLNYYYQITGWDEYKKTFPKFDQHSPKPQDPAFIDYSKFDFRLVKSSPAKSAGIPIPYIIVKDPKGVVDTINKYDFYKVLRSTTHPSIGVYE
jgi:hypothetical protein